MNNSLQSIDRLSIKLGQEMIKIDFESPHLIPFFGTKVPAGFPSPADDYLEDKIDLNDYASNNSPASFIVRVKGTSMVEAGIYENDLLIVDRSIDPTDGKIVVVAIDGNVTVKKLQIKNGKSALLPANPKYKAIEINENSNVEIFGVVASVLHKF